MFFRIREDEFPNPKNSQTTTWDALKQRNVVKSGTGNYESTNYKKNWCSSPGYLVPWN